MSTPVLLNLLNEMGKKIKCEACPAFHCFFSNKVNKFINTRVQIFDSTYHMKAKKS